jgi:hypothetical protein
MGLTLGIALDIDEAAIESGAASKGVADAAAVASRNNLTSLMVDYEPSDNVTIAHSQAYADFMTALSDALHAEGVESHMCISSWGILTTFDKFATTGTDAMMSMASTYYGKNVSSNEMWVDQELAEGVSIDQLHVGIGSTNTIYQKWDYQWTVQSFDDFMTFIDTRELLHVDIWRTDIDTTNATNGTAQWIYDGIADFLL